MPTFTWSFILPSAAESNTAELVLPFQVLEAPLLAPLLTPQTDGENLGPVPPRPLQ